MMPEESLALYERDVDAWNQEADKIGNGWMRIPMFELAVNAWLESQGSSQHQAPSLSLIDSAQLESELR